MAIRCSLSAGKVLGKVFLRSIYRGLTAGAIDLGAG